MINVICHAYLDWANDIETRSSTFGFFFCFIFKSCKLDQQKTNNIFFSPTKAKYMAYTLATKNTIWLW